MLNRTPLFQAGEKSCSTEYLFPRKDGSMQKLQIRSGLHAEEACGGNSKLPKVRDYPLLHLYLILGKPWLHY